MRAVCIALIALIGVAAARISIPLRRNKGEEVPYLRQSSEEVQVYSTPLNHTELQYYGLITVGTPAQEFYVIFDTASNLTWVPSVGCSLEQCENRTLFDNSKSSSYAHYGIWVSAPYVGGGSILGTAARETLNIAGIRVPEQLFVEATVIDPKIYNGVYFDGAVGLRLESRFTAEHWSVFDAMFYKNLLPEPKFSFYLHPTPEGYDGEIVLGGEKKDHYEGELTYTQSATDQWLFRLQGVKVGPRWVVTDYLTGVPVSTLPFIYGPEKQIDLIHKTLNATRNTHGEYVVECENVTSLPVIGFKISGKTFELRPEDYVVKVGAVCYSGFAIDRDHQEPGYGVWLLGQNFLRRVYAIFETGYFLWDKKIGFAYTRVLTY